jgi:UDP-N-acetylmuramoylalanine--D-glutamate ligase
MARPELTLVLGLGESGLAMARWLARQGVALRVADSRDTPPGVERLRAEAPAAEIVTGPFADSLLDGVVASPSAPASTRASRWWRPRARGHSGDRRDGSVRAGAA